MSAPSTTKILSDLVAFDTTSRNSNRPLLDYVVPFLRGYGIEPLLIWNEDRSKANLWATIGPRNGKGIILSGHTDTVPVDGQQWNTDPFALTERNSLLYGRGSCDMKGFLASVLALVPRLVESPLKRPIHIAFSHDEELGCIGVRSLIRYLREHPPQAACCIVGEPTLMQPVVGHKGGRSYRVRVTGREAHSSLAPMAVNAISYAAELIAFLNTIAESMRAGPNDPLYDVTHSTLSVGLINGGSAINIVPRHCEFTFEFRYLLGVDPEAIMARIQKHVESALLPRMRVTAPESDITFENIYAYPHFDIDPGHDLVTRVKSWSGSNGEAKVAYGTEAGYFASDLGIPTIVCGPGSIQQAHKPDEFVAREQLDACDAFLGRILSYCTSMP